MFQPVLFHKHALHVKHRSQASNFDFQLNKNQTNDSAISVRLTLPMTQKKHNVNFGGLTIKNSRLMAEIG